MRIKPISFGIHTVSSMVTDYDLCWINCDFLLSVKDPHSGDWEDGSWLSQSSLAMQN